MAGEGSKGGGGAGGLIFGEDGGKIQDLETYLEIIYQRLQYCSTRKINGGIIPAKME